MARLAKSESAVRENQWYRSAQGMASRGFVDGIFFEREKTEQIKKISGCVFGHGFCRFVFFDLANQR